MVGAVIYVRVSTKEQTENLSLPTQLRACEEYCRRQGYEVVERFHEEGESAKSTDRSQLQNLLSVLPVEQGPRPFRGRVQLDALCAGQVRPLRAPVTPAIAWNLPSLRNRADRRHLDWQANGRRARCVCAVRQRRALGSNPGRHACGAGARTLGVPGAARLHQRPARHGQERAHRSERAPLFAACSRVPNRIHVASVICWTAKRRVGPSSKVAPSKGAAGPGLQVAFEGQGAPLVSKL